MRFRLERSEGTQSTPGVLSIDGKFECFTLEDPVREPGLKIYGETAIPYGTFPVRLTYSRTFRRMLPAIEGVPMFSAIRIHGGNTVQDTLGCVLCGDKLNRDGTQILYGTTWPAAERIVKKLEMAEARGETSTIEIIKASI